MQDVLDEDGEVLVVYHVLPYKILENDYGDYAFTRNISEGELIARTKEELIAEVKRLCSEVIGTWGNDLTDLYGHELPLHMLHYRMNDMRKFHPVRQSWEDWQDFVRKVPANNMSYIKLGEYRIELRVDTGRVPDLVMSNEETRDIVSFVEDLHFKSRESLQKVIETKDEAAKQSTIARKRAELEKLKAELGEV